MKIVEIYTESDDKKELARGTVKYDPKKQRVIVDFPDREVVSRIMLYLTTPREYRIPESQVIDDYREEMKMPTTSNMHMDLALCTLWARTGVYVDWSKEREE